ncbi:DUF3320 domain-containing protein [Antarcticibacterium arcticum]|uniref:DUF3320 domain-containing protein n=1 Tax=Antarcticibacterium arcticum TaxID=2585771 RepID=A0A5B8YS10_9FLAO|nr:DUF3320 domain-containing protein [Antarcticibacterium arcticum]QED38999.1 DUF3320 domain-containing protein [Antarcticibacterium arcticum]
MDKNVAPQIERSRQELLDLGLRGNSLLHFKASAVSLTLTGHLSNEVYNNIVENQKRMGFSPLVKGSKEEVGKSERLPELFDAPTVEKPTSKNRFNTQLLEDQLDKRLLKINTEAETYFQEQGIDILYLAMGFLIWYEDKNSNLERKAPLILIPVSLKRSNAQDRYKLEYTQVDLSTNLTLKAKLKMDFNIELPEFSEEIEVQEYLKIVKTAIKKEDRWRIEENEMHLGFFKFGKFQMYQDLDAKNWPKNKQPSDHPILQSLFGNGFENFNDTEKGDFGEEDIFNGLQNLDEFHFIADADSSQTEAIIQIKQGKNLVIQGPPGTGKSQTITNIISEALSDDKKILFVSEKMVALEVVKRRLDSCYLGDCVLELHSHKSNKRTVLEEIGRTLELGVPKVDDRSIQKNRYKELQSSLDNYCEATGKKILNSGINFVQAVGYLLHFQKKIETYQLKGIEIPGSLYWYPKDFSEAETLVKEIVAFLNENTSPSKNPFCESQIDHFSPDDRSNMEHILKKILELSQVCEIELGELLLLLPISEPQTLLDIYRLIHTFRHLKNIPDVISVNYKSPEWLSSKDKIESCLKYGKTAKEIYDNHQNELSDEAWNTDLTEIKKVYETKGGKWWKFLSPDYWKAQKVMREIYKKELPSVPEILSTIDYIITFQENRSAFESYEELGRKLFLEKWKSIHSNWAENENIYLWLLNLYSNMEKEVFTPGIEKILDKISPVNDITAQFSRLETDIKELSSLIIQLNEILQVENLKDFEKESLQNLGTKYSIFIEKSQEIFSMARYNAIVSKLDKYNLNIVKEISFEWNFPSDYLLDLFYYSWYKSLVDFAYRTNDPIKFFDRAGHMKDIEEFKTLDNDLAHFSQEKLTMNHFQRMPRNSSGEMSTIKREINKKRRHMPIRQLLLQAGNAVQQIKPVFMMSPMSVSTFLSPGSLEFDLVIFDEASQVKVVDALIPILRGKQIVVVGDSKQMPPTDFFSRTFEDEEETVTGDIESILSMFLAQGAPEKMLKWHYRSRHDSLINVSNQEFYDGRLMVFPSSGINLDAKGLKFNHIKESFYERGTSRTNPNEARMVAQAIMNHAHRKPNLTLGVVAFSTAQRDSIILELERLRRQDTSYESFFSAEKLEEFFIKNLENVQGDERDVIFISIGYGKTAQGNLPQNFGPLNREGGERRLNVLITRARLAMEVFCNFTADDLNTSSNSPFGIKALKSFLKYAEHGKLEDRKETGKETDSPFEDQVIKAIKNMGYELEPQVGSAGFFIDIAVKDPERPGKYILAVECDGASYHSTVSARDRDRLRQNVLEGMGWKFHRIWSTDWFRTESKQISLLQAAIENAIRETQKENESNQKKELENFENSPLSITREDIEIVDNKSIPYKIFMDDFTVPLQGEIPFISKISIAKGISQIVKEEGPIHLKDVAKRITDKMGIGRIGNRIFDHIKESARYGHSQKWFYLSNNFIYVDESKEIEIRDRSLLPISYKNIEHVPPEEIQKAIFETIEMSFSISQTEVISETLSKMGFGRATLKASNIVKSEIKKLIRSQKIKMEQERLIIS